MKKIFSFRFDVDTYKCLSKGVPNLISLGDDLGVKFTFFVNVGKAISLSNYINRTFSKYTPSQSAKSLSALKKLGYIDYLYTALINPKIGEKNVEVLKHLNDHHEVGLHGGRNHDDWHHNVGSWSKERLKDEIVWSLSWLREIGIVPKGFSSPGWSTHPQLPEVLKELDFLYRADSHGVYTGGLLKNESIYNIETNLTAEPGGVAYIENARATGLNHKEVIEKFKRDMKKFDSYVVIYDHPYYAGIHEIDTIKEMIILARQNGYEVMPIVEAISHLRGH